MKLAGHVALTLAFAFPIGSCPEKENSAAYARVGVTQDRLTLAKDDGAALLSVDRSGSPTVVYHVTLNGAPEGEKLPLSCAWLDPSGHVVHENAYKTARIDKTVWPTHCRCLVGTASAPGTWKVEMRLGGRVLSSSTFEVR